MSRVTETEKFWRDDFTVTPDEEVDLQEYYLKHNQPMSLSEVTRYLMERQHRGRLEAHKASKGSYRPTGSYELGDLLMFPSLEGEVGEVIATRTGENKRYGSFQVIKVRFDRRGESREFATELSTANSHLLEAVEEPPMSLDDLFARFAALAQEEVEAALEASDNFVCFGGLWLPKMMLITFHEGHANIAEAMIDIMGEPLPASELLKEIPITDESSEAIRRFSLNYQLSQDARFTNVATDDSPLWYLPRLG